MKNKLLPCLILFSIWACKSNNPVQPEIKNELLGKWTETYQWKNYMSLGESIERTAVVDFGNNRFEVRTNPKIRIFPPNDSTFHTVLSGDSLYTGTYTLDKDTIIFCIDNQVNPFKMNYHITNDSLSLFNSLIKNVTINGTDTTITYLLSLNSFIWCNSGSKSEGQFSRIE